MINAKLINGLHLSVTRIWVVIWRMWTKTCISTDLISITASKMFVNKSFNNTWPCWVVGALKLFTKLTWSDLSVLNLMHMKTIHQFAYSLPLTHLHSVPCMRIAVTVIRFYQRARCSVWCVVAVNMAHFLFKTKTICQSYWDGQWVNYNRFVIVPHSLKIKI